MNTLTRALSGIAVAALTTGTLLVAPAGATEPPPPPTYHQPASGKTVRVGQGNVILVDLRAPSGTPYNWVVTRGKHTRVFKLYKRTTYTDGTGMPGAPYHTVWMIKGRHVGKATFKVVLRNVSDHSVARRFVLHVKVPPGNVRTTDDHVATGSTFTVKKGHKVTITLRTATDGGYGWAIVKGKHSPEFTVLSKTVVPRKHKPGVVGGDSNTVYVLRATATGRATFKVVERRSFDKTDVIDSYTLHLHITK